MSNIDVSINNWGGSIDTQPVVLASSIGDRASAQSLSIKLGTL
jgi:hypothetical protein